MRCEAEPVATVALRYAEREVVVSPLSPEPDPNHLELCRTHVERMTPPMGWVLLNARESVLATS
jgi:hypothetical protein